MGTTLRLAMAATLPHMVLPLLSALDGATLDRTLPSLHRDLLGARQRELVGRRVLGERGARAQRCAAPHAHRRHQLRVRTDEHVVLDDGAVLVDAVVVAGDGTRPDVDVLADAGVA